LIYLKNSPIACQNGVAFGISSSFGFGGKKSELFFSAKEIIIRRSLIVF